MRLRRFLKGPKRGSLTLSRSVSLVLGWIQTPVGVPLVFCLPGMEIAPRPHACSAEPWLHPSKASCAQSVQGLWLLCSECCFLCCINLMRLKNNFHGEIYPIPDQGLVICFLKLFHKCFLQFFSLAKCNFWLCPVGCL